MGRNTRYKDFWEGRTALARDLYDEGNVQISWGHFGICIGRRILWFRRIPIEAFAFSHDHLILSDGRGLPKSQCNAAFHGQPCFGGHSQHSDVTIYSQEKVIAESAVTKACYELKAASRGLSNARSSSRA